MARKARFDCVEEFVDAAFEKGARKIAEEYRDAVAVLVPTVVIIPRKGKLSTVEGDMFLDGHYVVLGEKTTRAELLKELGVEMKPVKKKADCALDVLDELGLQPPA